MKSVAPRRSPEDCLLAPTSVRLTTNELATIEEISDAIGRSRASIIRRLIVRGIEAYQLDPRHTVIDRMNFAAWTAKRAEATALISGSVMADNDS